MLLRKFFKYLIFIFFVPLVFLINFLKPFKEIKFYKIGSNRIGPFITSIEMIMYSREKINEIKNSKIIYYFDKTISNDQIEIMAKRYLSVSSNYTFYNLLCKAIFFWKKNKNHIIEDDYFYLPNILKIAPKWYKESKTYLHFTPEEKKRGFKLLDDLGIKNESKWICIQNRDSSYLDKFFPKQGSPKFGGDWSYHNYRDFSVKSLQLAAEFFASKGYYVLRVGKTVKETLNTKNSKIIDYANSKLRSDFADIFLLSNCKAYFGGSSGIESVPEVYKIPKYNVNYPSTDITKTTQICPWRFIFKRIKSLETNKYLSIKEILKSNFAYSTNTHDFTKNNVINVDNNEEDIKLFAEEVEKELRNELIENNEDKKIQEEFWKIYFKYVDKNKIGNMKPQISPSFLKNNLDLLN